MNLKFYIGENLSSEIIKVPLYDLINFSDSITINSQSIEKTNLVIVGPENSEDVDFLNICYNKLKENQSFLLRIYDITEKSNSPRSFFVMDNKISFMSIAENFLERYDKKVYRCVSDLYLSYMLCDIMEKALQEDEKWDYLFRVDCCSSKPYYNLLYGKEYNFDSLFSSIRTIHEYVQETVSELKGE